MASRGERTDIERAIKSIANRIVRGKHARHNKAVKFYRVNRALTLVASTFTSIGVSNPLLTVLSGQSTTPTIGEAFKSFNGLPIIFSVIGVVCFIIVILLKQFYVEEGVEKKAVQALGLFESLVRLEVRFRNYLDLAEPSQQLVTIHESVMALEEAYAMIMPDEDNFDMTQVDMYVQRLIDVKCGNWNSGVQGDERRSK